MQDLRALLTFVRVAERQSFVRAAADLGITQSGVSNAIARLEAQLGVRLLARTTRRVGLTEDGAAFFERCRQILSDLEEAELVLKDARVRPAGRLHIDLPVSFGRLKVMPLLGAFQKAYPEVNLAISFTDRYVDLVDEGIDAAVRFGPLQDSSLIARRLTEAPLRLVATPAYLATHGRPKTPDQLGAHNCLSFIQRDTRMVRPWRFVRNGTEVAYTPAGSMSFTDGAAVADACKAGYGIAQLRGYFIDAALARRALEPLLEKFEPPADPIWVVYPQAQHLSPKVRVFIDFLTAQFRKAGRARDRRAPPS